MNFESFEEIIVYAIEKENEAAAFYADAATKEPFSGVREALEEMANEERKHAAMLENIGENKEALKDYEFKWIPDIKRSDYMVDLVYEPGMHYSDLLKLAMKREEKALAMYNDLQNKTDNEEYIKLFKVLCQEEAKHKRFLENLYDDYMAEQGD
ncbi:MAG: ferritin family protein [Desulfobacterales bacterium]|nr:MAG: ferritin family protein [Desulfobacterales bacterium]UCD90468.1 MAG: ferritin family protein [Desulfobacterales bacterium]